MRIGKALEAVNVFRMLREWNGRRGSFWDDSLPNHDGDAYVLDLRGEAPVAAPRRGRPGRHRQPPRPATVTFPAVTGTIPRVVPACGTRPPWDTASFPEVPDEAAPQAAPAEAPAEPGSPAEPEPAPAEKDELQEYLDRLPGYPAD